MLDGALLQMVQHLIAANSFRPCDLEQGVEIVDVGPRQPKRRVGIFAASTGGSVASRVKPTRPAAASGSAPYPRLAPSESYRSTGARGLRPAGITGSLRVSTFEISPSLTPNTAEFGVAELGHRPILFACRLQSTENSTAE